MPILTGNDFNLSKSENAILSIENMDQVSFFVTSFSVPGISIGTTPLANPFKEHSEPSKKLTYSELEVELLVDEQFASWKAIYDWISEAANGYSFSTSSITRRSGSILLTTNNMNPNYRIRFVSMFPISLSNVQVDLQEDTPTPLTFSTTFVYERYTFDTIS